MRSVQMRYGKAAPSIVRAQRYAGHVRNSTFSISRGPGLCVRDRMNRSCWKLGLTCVHARRHQSQGRDQSLAMVCTCGAAPPAGVTSVKMASGFLACLGWAVSTAWCQVLQLASHESRAQTHSIAQPQVAPAYLSTVRAIRQLHSAEAWLVHVGDERPPPWCAASRWWAARGPLAWRPHAPSVLVCPALYDNVC